MSLEPNESSSPVEEAAEAYSYCRLCASRAPLLQLRSFATTGADSDSLFDAVRQLRAGIRRADGLPQGACLDCVPLLQAVSVFLRRVAAAQLTLVSLFHANLSIKKEEPESDFLTEHLVGDEYSTENLTEGDVEIKGEISGLNNAVIMRKNQKQALEWRVRKRFEDKSVKESGQQLEDVPRCTQEVAITNTQCNARWSDYFYCRRCGHRAVSMQGLREHSWQQHARCVVFKCPLCSVRMFTYKHFLQHMPLHRAGLRRCCELCDEYFESAVAASRHRELLHPGVDSPHRCANCGTAFSSAEELKGHRETFTIVRASTTGQNLYRCSHCPKTYPNKIGLIGHIDCHDPTKNICAICNKRYKNKYGLNQHLSVIHGNRVDFICQVCGQGFKRKADLKGHLDVHSGLKPFSCKTCAKKFRTDNQLKAHLVCHTEENLFVCKICNKSYKYRSGLRDHLLAHSNDRPYSCNVCSNKSFISWSNYNKHMKAIHNKNMAKNKILKISV